MGILTPILTIHAPSLTEPTAAYNPHGLILTVHGPLHPSHPFTWLLSANTPGQYPAPTTAHMPPPRSFMAPSRRAAAPSGPREKGSGRTPSSRYRWGHLATTLVRLGRQRHGQGHTPGSLHAPAARTNDLVMTLRGLPVSPSARDRL